MMSAALLALFAVASSADALSSGISPPMIWPLPREYTYGTTKVTVETPGSFSMTADAQEPALGLLNAALERLRPRLFLHGDVTASIEDAAVSLTGVKVSVSNADSDLQLGVDESYVLDVPAGGLATLSAKTVFGAYHGLETLSQLVTFNFTSGAYQIEAAPWHIEDSPRFPHRELLIDSSRHFEPIPVVTSLIESLAMAKINVLHWHIVDIQSFPAPSRVHPEFAEKGAYSQSERYTWEELRHVVEFARARGVRVVPEFDMPAHTDSWSKAHPELFPKGCKSAFDPANEQVYKLIEEMLRDWADVFTDDIVHLGTDELPESCWNNTEDLAFMKKQGLKSLDELFGYFVARVVKIAHTIGKRAQVWDESIIRSNSTPTDALIQIWHSSPGLLQKAIDAGHDAVYSPDGPWYLDGLGSTWEDMYSVEPYQGLAPAPGRVIGGGGEMWGETVDPSDIESTVWPRLAAIAERLWSPAQAIAAGPDAARPRLQAFRCLLLHRDVRSGLVGGNGRVPPPGPGGCSQAGKADPALAMFV
eukprot:TRINITY_DN22339_c0_g1_i1.p1 TRINITY_DN22339_c0_g1~~TRINITY_DN22339_c0_g1_i1.p1  ORF type:complete len:532 (+),score=87.01 TRINITY_DN22339_c0_g1_i1:94-1689(+)